MQLRAPREDDWPSILDLAHRSLVEMIHAPRQDEWLKNRRSFRPSDGTQEHFVASVEERIVGYAAIERRIASPIGVYRLYLVVEPPNRAMLGAALLAELRRRLIRVGALQAWMMEYEADEGFIAYLERMGFERAKTVAIGDRIAVEMKLDAPFDLLTAGQHE